MRVPWKTLWATTVVVSAITIGCMEAGDLLGAVEGAAGVGPPHALVRGETLGNLNDNGAGNGNDNSGGNGNDNGGNDNGTPNGNDNSGLLGACCLADGSCALLTFEECEGLCFGDMNCDGLLDFGDINPFVLALSNPAAYATAFPNCDLMLGDINGDGVFDFKDINPFVVSVGLGCQPAGIWLGAATTCDQCTGGNGNDNGANGNDNGGNGNDNGANGNDNGANGNDNGSGDLCPDGSFQVRTDMSPGDDNRAEYRWFPGGCERFRVRVRDFPAFQSFNVTIAGVFVGTVFTDDDGRAELEYHTEDGTFPPDFPEVFVGDIVDVGGLTSGAFALDCSDNSNCNGNGNANGNGNTNGSP